LRKIDFKKKILKTLIEELNMMCKILEKPFQEHIIQDLKRIKKLIKTLNEFKKFKNIKFKGKN